MEKASSALTAMDSSTKSHALDAPQLMQNLKNDALVGLEDVKSYRAGLSNARKLLMVNTGGVRSGGGISDKDVVSALDILTNSTLCLSPGGSEGSAMVVRGE